MKSPTKFRFRHVAALKQRGVVLFFALIALLAMSLAAVALIRSVDTGTMIAGNLAFKQSATIYGDSGIETAITAVAAMSASPLSVLTDPAHPANVTCLSTRAAGTLNANDPGCPAVIAGYHSNIDPALVLTDDKTWDGINNTASVYDPVTGNSTRYIIQRMCRIANIPVFPTPQTTADCLFGPPPQLGGRPANIRLPDEICDSTANGGCPQEGQSPMMRITARIDGPRNTVSYVQAFVY